MKKIFFMIVLFSLSLNVMARSRARPDRSMDAIILYGMGLSRLDNEIEIGSLSHLDKQQLRILRNTIFARYGYIFASNDMEDYFSRFQWYNGVSRDVQDRLTRTDWLNIALIQSLENAEVSPGFVRIEGGTFQMGSNNGRPDESPVHTVTVSSFYMGRTEVTQKEWAVVLREWAAAMNKSNPPSPAVLARTYYFGQDYSFYGDTGSSSIYLPYYPSYFNGDNLPVEQVSWVAAVEYCNRRSQLEGLTPAYTLKREVRNDQSYWAVTWDRSANGWRLPTEAEWEYAAKGGNGSPGNYTYSGSNNVDEVAWYGEEYGERTTRWVGTKKPNGLGLYDMSGNVYEWCWDWYDANHYSNSYFSDGPQNDPMVYYPGLQRVVRGGCWSSREESVRSTYRLYGYEREEWSGVGFRLVRNAD
jgi:formylglycine-generating enzyme required for sulfatase activity